MVIQVGDVLVTHADLHKLEDFDILKPKTLVEEGLEKFVKWYWKIKS
jgi:hypothetical protein